MKYLVTFLLVFGLPLAFMFTLPQNSPESASAFKITRDASLPSPAIKRSRNSKDSGTLKQKQRKPSKEKRIRQKPEKRRPVVMKNPEFKKELERHREKLGEIRMEARNLASEFRKKAQESGNLRKFEETRAFFYWKLYKTGLELAQEHIRHQNRFLNLSIKNRPEGKNTAEIKKARIIHRKKIQQLERNKFLRAEKFARDISNRRLNEKTERKKKPELKRTRNKKRD